MGASIIEAKGQAAEFRIQELAEKRGWLREVAAGESYELRRAVRAADDLLKREIRQIRAKTRQPAECVG